MRINPEISFMEYDYAVKALLSPHGKEKEQRIEREEKAEREKKQKAAISGGKNK